MIDRRHFIRRGDEQNVDRLFDVGVGLYVDEDAAI